MNQIMRWNMESDAKETAFKKMKEDAMPYKLQDHVVANLMQAYMAVTNTTYAEELPNTPMNYWPGEELAFAEDYGKEFDKQLETERNKEAYAKSRCYVHETVKNFKKRYGSIKPESPVFYSTKLPTGIKRSHDEAMNDGSDEEMEKEIVESCFLLTDRSAEGLDT